MRPRIQPQAQATVTLAGLLMLCGCAGTPSAPQASSPDSPSTDVRPAPGAIERLKDLATRQKSSGKPNPGLPPPPGIDAAAVARLPAADLTPTSTAMQGIEDAVKAVLSAEAPAAVAPIASKPAGPEAKAEALRRFAHGRELAESGKAAEALVEFQAAAKADPSSPDPWMQIAEVNGEQGRRTAASSALMQAVRRGQNDPRTLWALGRDSLRSLRREEALWLLCKARAAAANEQIVASLTNADLAEAMEQSGRLAAAASMYATAAEPLPDPAFPGEMRAERSELLRRRGEFLQRAGDLNLRLGRDGEAVRLYERAATEPSLDAGAAAIRRIYAAARLGRPAEGAVVLIEKIKASKGRVEDRELAIIRYLSADRELAPALSDALGEVASEQTLSPSVASRLARARAAVLPAARRAGVLMEHLARAPGDADAAADLAASFDAGRLSDRDAAVVSLVARAPRFSGAFAELLMADGRGVIEASERLAKKDDPASRLLAAELMGRLGRPLEAVKLLDSAPAPAGWTAAVEAAAAELAALGGDYVRAETAAARLRDSKEPGSAIGLVRALASLQRFAAAQEASGGDAAWPTLAFDDKVLVASVALRAGDAARAEALLKRLVAEDPFDERASEVLIRVYSGSEKAEDQEKLIGVLKALRESVASSRVLRWIGAGELAQRGQWAQTESALLSLAEENASSPGLVELLCAAWMRQGGEALPRGEKWLGDKLAAAPQSIELIGGMARVLAAQDKGTQAVALLDSFTARAPVPALLRTRETITEQTLNDAALANKLRMARLGVPVRPIDDTLTLADLMLTGDRAGEAAGVLSAGLPASVPLTGDQETALRQLVIQAIQRDLELAPKGKPIVSPAICDVAIARLGRLPLPLLEGRVMAMCLVDTPAHEQIARAIGEILDLAPDQELNSAGRIGVRLLNSAREKGLLVYAEALVAAKPNPSPERLAFLAEALWKVGDGADAKRLFPTLIAGDRAENLLERIPDLRGEGVPPRSQQPEELAYRLALRTSIRGREDAADGFYELVLSINPRHTMACNDYGYRLLEEGKDLPRAARLIEQAYKNDDRNQNILDSIGWLRYRQGKISDKTDEAGRIVEEGALRLLLKAKAELGRGESAELMGHLGDTYWVSGQKEEAVRHWTRSVQHAESTLREHGGQSGAAPNSDEAMYDKMMIRMATRIKHASEAKLAAAKDGQAPPVAPMTARDAIK